MNKFKSDGSFLAAFQRSQKREQEKKKEQQEQRKLELQQEQRQTRVTANDARGAAGPGGDNPSVDKGGLSASASTSSYAMQVASYTSSTMRSGPSREHTLEGSQRDWLHS